MTALDLDTLHYSGTDLCEPADPGFHIWLEAIPSRRRTEVQCAPLTDRDALVALYWGTGGFGWTNSDGWLTEAPLQRWHGVEVDARGRVTELYLSFNGLSSAIPPELSALANLRHLSLSWNNLSGAIPTELGNLANLVSLGLSWNNLSGAIPTELGNLANLKSLGLSDNNLSGAIPTELGNLANLESLGLSDNNLSGAIPTELGKLANLWALDLTGNDLSGAIPSTLSRLASLTALELSNNAGLVGAVPAELRTLGRLDRFLAGGTDLCVPRERAFEQWLATIPEHWIALCGKPPAAYLVQAVQSRPHPVPLVAGEEALLRVFVTATQANEARLPPVRASFYAGGALAHVADVRGKPGPIPTDVEEGSLAASANAVVPGEVVRPGLEMVIEIDPDGTLDPGLGVAKRIPETGRLPVDVREMPLFELTLIPFLWRTSPDSAVLEHAADMAADPEGQEALDWTRIILPVADLEVTAHEPVLTSSNDKFELLRETKAIRAMEAGSGHYMGLMSREPGGGVANLGGRESFSFLDDDGFGPIAHELGHNFSLSHAPCGGAGSPDPAFPTHNASIGAWGYDFRHGGRLIPPFTKDLMSYCGSWIGDYHFTKALRYRLVDEGPPASAAAERSLLLWGGQSADAVPYLEPAFLVEAPAALPDSAGEYRISGRSNDGGELFALRFAMPETADGDGSSSFAFALPVRPAWQGNLGSITLTGPDGSFTLDGDSDIPMAILRNAQTGQIRGILRDSPPAAQAAAGGQGTGTRIEVLFSRGLPDAAAWRR